MPQLLSVRHVVPLMIVCYTMILLFPVVSIIPSSVQIVHMLARAPVPAPAHSCGSDSTGDQAGQKFDKRSMVAALEVGSGFSVGCRLCQGLVHEGRGLCYARAWSVCGRARVEPLEGGWGSAMATRLGYTGCITPALSTTA